MLNFLIRVLKRIAYNHYISILVEARFSIRINRITSRAIKLLEKNYILEVFIQSLKLMLI